MDVEEILADKETGNKKKSLGKHWFPIISKERMDCREQLAIQVYCLLYTISISLLPLQWKDSLFPQEKLQASINFVRNEVNENKFLYFKTRHENLLAIVLLARNVQKKKEKKEKNHV